MMKLVGVAFFGLLLAPLPTAAAEGAADFLSRLLATDFDGDCIPRHDNVFYTDGKAEVGDCGCSEPRENFTADQDPLVIISRWRVVGTRMETLTKAVVTVESRVIATAEGQNEKRKILPLPQLRDDVVDYRVWKRRPRSRASSGSQGHQGAGSGYYDHTRLPSASARGALAGLGFIGDGRKGNYRYEGTISGDAGLWAIADLMLETLYRVYGARPGTPFSADAPLADGTPTPPIPRPD